MKMRIQRRTRPDRVEVNDSTDNWLATLTDGAYTVTLTGPVRTFTEPTVAHPVTHGVWVRTLPAPFDGNLDWAWLKSALKANTQAVPDVAAIAMQYIAGAPVIFEDGFQIAGDASYGPLKNGEREEGSDFNDYLGIEWVFPEQVDKPEKRQLHCLDCSGFIRMVWGYRRHLSGKNFATTVPLCLKPQKSHRAIPRRAFEICNAAPGVVIVPDTKVQIKDFSLLGVGDLVFFDADENDGTQIDHVGIYLGLDAGNHHRFISSRKGANGPTLGDYKGKSILDGTGLYARAFRAVRRL
jgi:cell wall-associated NlpC family hydrolase